MIKKVKELLKKAVKDAEDYIEECLTEGRNVTTFEVDFANDASMIVSVDRGAVSFSIGNKDIERHPNLESLAESYMTPFPEIEYHADIKKGYYKELQEDFYWDTKMHGYER